MGEDGTEILPDLSGETEKNKENKTEEKEVVEESNESLSKLKETVEQNKISNGTYETAKSDITESNKIDISVKDNENIQVADITVSAGADLRKMTLEKAKEQWELKKQTLEKLKNDFTDIHNKAAIEAIIKMQLSPENIESKIIDKSNNSKNNVEQHGNRYLIAARIAEGFIQSLEILKKNNPQPILSLTIDRNKCIIGKSTEVTDKSDDRFFMINAALTITSTEEKKPVQEQKVPIVTNQETQNTNNEQQISDKTPNNQLPTGGTPTETESVQETFNEINTEPDKKIETKNEGKVEDKSEVEKEKNTKSFNTIGTNSQISSEEESQIPLKNTSGTGEQIDNQVNQIREGNNVEQNRIDVKKNILIMSENIEENKKTIEALTINPDNYFKKVELSMGNYVLTLTDKNDAKNTANIKIDQQGKILNSEIIMNGKNYTIILTSTGIQIEENKNNKASDEPQAKKEEEKIETESDGFVPISVIPDNKTPMEENTKTPEKKATEEVVVKEEKTKDTNPPIEKQKENTEFTIENLQAGLPEKTFKKYGLTYERIFNSINDISNPLVKNTIAGYLLKGDVRGAQIYVGMKEKSQYKDNKADGKLGENTLSRLTNSLFGLEGDALEAYKGIPLDVKDTYKKFKNNTFDEKDITDKENYDQDSPFAIVSKSDNKMYIFSVDRRLISVHPVILGKTPGNEKNEVYKNSKKATTPSGMYQVDSRATKPEEFLNEGEYVGLLPLKEQYDRYNDKFFTLGFHTPPKGPEGNKRVDALNNKPGTSRRMSNGCINTLSEGSIYDNLPTGSMFYVTDEPK